MEGDETMRLFRSRSEALQVAFCDACQCVCDVSDAVDAAREKAITRALQLFPAIR
jgi:hypothetical protein